MKLSNRKTNDFCIIDIDGRIDTTNFNEFEKEVTKSIDACQINIVLNCSKMSYISSSGLRVFLIAHEKIENLGGKLYLCALQPTIREIFDISGFSKIFKIFESEEKAVEN